MVERRHVSGSEFQDGNNLFEGTRNENGSAGFGPKGWQRKSYVNISLDPSKGSRHICHMFPSDISHGETFIWILDLPTFPYHHYPSNLNLRDLRVWLGKEMLSIFF